MIGIGIVGFVFLFANNSDDWTSLFGGQPRYSATALAPGYVMGMSDPVFGPECRGTGVTMGGGGYGYNYDLEYHVLHSSVIVEGTARIAGPASFGFEAYDPDSSRHRKMTSAGGIKTPFVIEVSKTHKGLDRSSWSVATTGGLVDCVSYRTNADSSALFDGAKGLFFISGSSEFPGDRVAMAITTDGPEWFVFTEENFGSIEDAVELIRSVE